MWLASDKRNAEVTMNGLDLHGSAIIDLKSTMLR